MAQLTKKTALTLIISLIIALALIPGVFMLAKVLRKVEAYDFIVNNELWFTIAAEEKTTCEQMLAEYQQQYLADVDQDAQIKNVYFLQKVEFRETEVQPEELDPLTYAQERIYAINEETQRIEVQDGDNLWDLTKTHHLELGELEILNPDLDPDKIYPGDLLVIKPVDPVLDVIVELENTVAESIGFRVEYRKDNTMYTSQRKIIKEGIEGEKEVVYDITMLNGYQHSLNVKSETVTRQPVNAQVRIGTKTTVSRGGSANYGVVNGKRISSLFGNRIHPITGRKTYHEGLDIAANHGNSVYVYTSGTVVQAGWNGGYGLSVLVDHGGGLKTRYAHLSKISVKVGQKVKTGNKVGAIGSTGNSTGPHLHFEVIRNGQPVNPLNYI